LSLIINLNAEHFKTKPLIVKRLLRRGPQNY